MKVCSVEGCGKEYCAKGYCKNHYNHFYFKNKEQRNNNNCKIEGCESKAYKKGMCNRHYQISVYDKENAKKWNKKYHKTEKGKESIRKNNHNRRARKKKALVEKFSIKDVYIKNHYVCCICGLPINPILQYPDGHSVSLEHKIPLSKNGEHSLNNCAPAHYLCNVRKNNRLIENNFEGASI